MMTGKCEILRFNEKFDEEYFPFCRLSGNVRSAFCFSYCKARLERVKCLKTKKVTRCTMAVMGYE
jgi:hypothetical protein